MKTAAQNSLVQEIQNNVEKIINGSKHLLADKLAIENDCKCYQNGVVKALESLRNHLKEAGTEIGQEYLAKLNSVSQDVQEDVEPKKEKPTDTADTTPGTIKYVYPKDLTPHPAVVGFYKIYPEVYTGLVESMIVNGFDPGSPVQGCKDENGIDRVWDGLTRLKAAIEANIKKKIPVVFSHFKSVDEMIMKVISVHARRRNFDDHELLVSVSRLMEIAAREAKKNQGKRKDLASVELDTEVTTLNANEYIAKMVGKSASTVARVKRVLKNPKLAEAVFAGAKTMNAAYSEITDSEKSNEDTIGNTREVNLSETPDIPVKNDVDINFTSGSNVLPSSIPCMPAGESTGKKSKSARKSKDKSEPVKLSHAKAVETIVIPVLPTR